MRHTTIACKAYFVSFITVFYSLAAYAQPIDPVKDAIPEEDARGLHDQYKGQVGRKASEALFIYTDQMLEIATALKTKGINHVNFMIGSLRKKDIAKYRSHHPELASLSDKELKKKHILIIKVPDNLFDSSKQSGAFNRSKSNSLIIALESIGLINLDLHYSWPTLQGYLYLELSIICPPPNVCN